MPNWTYSQLRISGEPKQLNKFLKEVERTPLEAEAENKHEATKFAFDRIIPMPYEMWEGEKWYEWRIENWGTKWECSIDYETIDQWESGEVFIEYRTAWSPPMPIMEAVVKKYPKLLFSWKFYEESYEFWGYFIGEKGELISDYDGEFRNCEDYAQFGLTHHYCNTCENHYECAEIADVSVELHEQICVECKAKETEADKEVSKLDEQLWEGELENGREALSH